MNPSLFKKREGFFVVTEATMERVILFPSNTLQSAQKLSSTMELAKYQAKRLCVLYGREPAKTVLSGNHLNSSYTRMIES
jgi:hypothetical protein